MPFGIVGQLELAYLAKLVELQDIAKVGLHQLLVAATTLG